MWTFETWVGVPSLFGRIKSQIKAIRKLYFSTARKQTIQDGITAAFLKHS